MNESALPTRDVDRWLADAEPAMREGYAAAGVRLDHCGRARVEGETSWGARLHGGRPAPVLAIEGARSSR